MRHCFISWSYIKDGSTRSLNEYCLALSRASHQVTLIARGDEAPYFINENLYVVPINAESTISEKIAHGIFFWKVIRQLHRESYDTINAFNSPGISILPFVLGKKRSKWMMHIRTSSIGGKFADKLKNFALRYEASLFDQITIIDKNIANLIGFNQNQINNMIELPLGINPDNFSHISDQRVELYGENISDKMVFIYVGKMDPTRCLHKLLESVRIVKAAGYNISLIMLGSGTHVPDLIKLADESGINDSIIFAGKVPQEEVPKYIASADVGITYIPITPTYDHQPPLKAFEYLQTGIPQVATSTAAIKKIIHDNINGILRTDDPADYADGMLALLNDEDLRKNIQKSSKEGLSEYYWDNICKQILIPCYETILSDRSSTKNI